MANDLLTRVNAVTDLSRDEEIAARVLERARKIILGRKAGDPDADDLIASTAMLALADVAQGRDWAEATAIAAYRALGDHGSHRAVESEIVTNYGHADEVEALPALAVWRAPRPDGITETTVGDDLADVFDLVYAEDADAAEIVAVAGEVAEWRNGLPSASAVGREITGTAPVGRAQTAMRKRISEAFDLAREAAESVIYRKASDGARRQRPVWTNAASDLAAESVERSQGGPWGVAKPGPGALASRAILTRPNGDQWLIFGDRYTRVIDGAEIPTELTTWKRDPATREADEWAAATTPRGPVAKRSRKSKGPKGGVGGSVIMVRPAGRAGDSPLRGEWAGKVGTRSA